MGLKVAKKPPTASALRKRKAAQRIRKQAKRKAKKQQPSWRGALKRGYLRDVLKSKGASKSPFKKDKKKNPSEEAANPAPEEATEVQEEVDEEKMKRLNERDPLESQLFLKNLPVDANEEEIIELLRPFGEVRRVLLVKGRVSKMPTGTGFVHCGTAELAEKIFEASRQNAREISAMNREEMKEKTKGTTRHQAKRLEYKLKRDTVQVRDPFITLRGIRVTVHRVLSRTDSQEVTASSQKKKKTLKVAGDDPRNLYLLQEGHITPESPAARELPPKYVEALQRDYEMRKESLKNTNLFVSRTRLNVRNIPKTVNERELRLLFNKTARKYLRKHPEDLNKEEWGKYGPSKEIKIVKDANGVSRGYAFIELANHNVALNALRMLNNNPEVYGPKHRPRISFAIEDIMALQKLQQIRERKRQREREELHARNNEE